MSLGVEAANGTEAAEKMIPEDLDLLVLGVAIYRHALIFPLALSLRDRPAGPESDTNFSRLSRVSYACRVTPNTGYKRIPYRIY